METPERELQRKLTLWCPGEDIESLIQRAIDQFGPHIARGLPLDPTAARDQLLDRIGAVMG